MTFALQTDSLPADVSGWYASPKMDGIRAIWTGSALITRSGHKLNPPAELINNLPDARLDGELWMGPGTFDQLQSTLQKKGSKWEGVEFHIFDLAETGLIEQRQAKLQGMSEELTSNAAIKIVTHTTLENHAQLDAMEKSIVDGGGEGVVIRRPGSKYRPMRSSELVKVKRLVLDIDRWQG